MKFNKKQKKIMRGGALVLFSISLILILKLAFNIDVNNNENEYVGTWYVGYKFYEGETKDKMLSAFSQKMTLFSNNTFEVKEIEGIEGTDTSVSGTYEINNNEITLKYKQQGDEQKTTYYFKGNKMCMDNKCERYYLKDKLEYFEQFNAQSETVDE